MSAESLALAQQMHAVVAATKESFAAAFIEQTKMHPTEAVMKYGIVTVDNRAQFRVWFEHREDAAELTQLRALATRVAKGEDCKADAIGILLSLGISTS